MAKSHPLTDWFKSVGVELHPSLYLKHDALTGLSVYAATPLPPDTTVVTVPASLCITSEVAYEQVCRLLSRAGATSLPQHSELPVPDWILLYLVLCRIAIEHASSTNAFPSDLLPHLTYVAHIPKCIPTPLHFSPTEYAMLANTPLQGSTERRLAETIVDFHRASSCILPHILKLSQTGLQDLVEQIQAAFEPIEETRQDKLMTTTWHAGLEMWRWAESAFTSRAFPSSLIGITVPAASVASNSNGSSAFTSPTSNPILIPAYDAFNHARAHPVTWTHIPAPSTHPDTAAPHAVGSTTVPESRRATGRVQMTLNYAVDPADSQVFNNYGGKSNEEFLSAYGFVLPTTTEDTLALKIGTQVQSDADADAHDDKKGTGSTTFYWPATSASDAASSSDQPIELSGGDGKPFVPARCPCPGLIEQLGAELRRQPASLSSSPLIQLEEYANVIEVLESLLLAKRKQFRASQKQVDSIEALQETDFRPEVARSPTSSVRKPVFEAVQQYRLGQLEILNQAVKWARGELERLADALEDDDDEDQE
ncbi:SET domain-containing protein [Testicularia cyperi]|uniref:SET domain-containing protein n=1 Tax=Testicularia cyperi TaxID=1882483 RepID=A0A317XTC9_9BASI|nr:SET domain-containing protein [Testicularia cyperi]